MFKVTFSNSKLGSIGSINLPAGITCRVDAPCRKGCYAMKGTFNFPNVKSCYQENLNTYLNDPVQAEKDILNQLPLMGWIRIHASGDIVDENYFLMLVRIAKKAKGVKFMMFTKKYEIVNDYLASGKKIPSNLKVILSNWLNWKCENPYNLPTAELHDCSLNNEIPKKAIPCSGQCDKCFSCWNLRKNQTVMFEKH